MSCTLSYLYICKTKFSYMFLVSVINVPCHAHRISSTSKHFKVTPWSRFLLEKLIVAQLEKKLPCLLWKWISLPFWQQLVIGPFPEQMDPSKNSKSCVTFPGLLVFTSNSQTRGGPLVGCPRLISQYIHTCPPYLVAVFSVHNRATQHPKASP